MDKPSYWRFFEQALTGLPAGSTGTDPDATRLLLSLNRASGVVTYDLEASIHRPRGRSWAAYRLMFVL